jgi:hypothetical protein
LSHAILSLWCLISMAQMTSVGKVKTHEPIMWLHDSLIDLKICWATTQALYIDTPLLGV